MYKRQLVNSIIAKDVQEFLAKLMKEGKKEEAEAARARVAEVYKRQLQRCIAQCSPCSHRLLLPVELFKPCLLYTSHITSTR